MSMPPKLNLNIPLSSIENKPFGPYKYPGSASDNWADAPAKPMQQCHASQNDLGNYAWNRTADCYIALPNSFISGANVTNQNIFMKLESSVCNGVSLPAYKNTDYSSYGIGTYTVPPVATYTYNGTGTDPLVPYCSAGYNVSPWGTRTP